jgi:hypothetical protein
MRTPNWPTLCPSMEKVLRCVTDLGATSHRGGKAYKTEPLDQETKHSEKSVWFKHKWFGGGDILQFQYEGFRK